MGPAASAPAGKRHLAVADTRLGIILGHAEGGVEGFARRHHAVNICTLAGQDIGQDLRRRIIGRIGTRHAIGDEAQDVRQIAVEGEGFRLDRGKIDRRVLRHRMVGNVAKQLLDLGDGRGWIHIADDHQDGIAGGVPLLVKVAQHGAGGGVEGRPGAQGIVRVGRARKHIGIQAIDEFVSGIGEVAGHLLFDRASFVGPLCFGIVDAAQAGGLGVEGNVQVGGGNGGVELGDVLLGIGIVAAAQLGVDGGGLIGSHAGAAAKGHVFLGMGRSREAGWRLISTDLEVQLHRDHGRQRVAHDDDLQAVGEGGTGHVAGVRGMDTRRKRGEQEKQGQQGFELQFDLSKANSRRWLPVFHGLAMPDYRDDHSSGITSTPTFRLCLAPPSKTPRMGLTSL